MIKTTINKLEKSEIEIIGNLEWSEFEKYEEKALENIGQRIELPGFRKGKAPANMIKETASEIEILEEMAQVVLSKNYMNILEENKIDAIGHPKVQITKIGKGSDLEFKIITAILPEIKLPDYKEIAKKEGEKEEFKKEIESSDEEVEKVIKDLRKMRAEQKNNENHEGHENMTEEEHKNFHETKKEISEDEWPELNDEFVKSFGDFENVDAFKDKIKNNLKIEKETELKDKLRLSIVEEILKQSEGEIPEILIQSETDKILYRLQADVTNAGIKFEDYLKQINKNEEDLRKEWRGDAEKRAKLQMIMHKISKEEKLEPTEEEIERDVTQITTMYKDADPARARAYVEQMLENEKVFKFLEEQQ